MSTLQAITLDQVVDTDRYPLSDPDSTEARAVVARARRELAEVGCTVLPDFVRPELHGVLRQECAALAPHAYFDVETVNVYNIDVDTDLPEDHPEAGAPSSAATRSSPATGSPAAPSSAGSTPTTRSSASSRTASDCPGCTSWPTRSPASCSTSYGPAWNTPGTSTPTSTRSAC